MPTSVAVVSTWAYSRLLSTSASARSSSPARGPHLDEVPPKPDVRAHGPLQIYLVAHFALTCVSIWVSQSRAWRYAFRDDDGAPRSVLSRVSFASQTLNHPPCASLWNSTTVRHAPLTAIESPTWQSPRMGAESPMVSVHPPSSCTISVTVPRCSICKGAGRGQNTQQDDDDGVMLHTRPVNILLCSPSWNGVAWNTKEVAVRIVREQADEGDRARAFREMYSNTCATLRCGANGVFVPFHHH